MNIPVQNSIIYTAENRTINVEQKDHDDGNLKEDQ